MPWPIVFSVLLTAVLAMDCPLQVTYVPSPLEVRWMQNIGHYASQDPKWTHGCAAAKADAAHIAEWIRFCTEVAQHPDLLTYDRPSHPGVFSYHVIAPRNPQPGCPAARYVPIEPLAVALRHPKWPCLSGPHKKPSKKHWTRQLVDALLFDTGYLLFLPVPSYTSVGRAFFFDLGSTYYDCSWPTEHSPRSGPSTGQAASSLKEFIRKYRAISGVEFDEVFAWEVRPLDHRACWNKVPRNMSAKLHIYNTPTSADLEHSMSALRMVLQVAKPADFVVVKLDIDNNQVEVAIILAILRTPALISLINELYWELHVRGEARRSGRGGGTSRGSRGTTPPSSPATVCSTDSGS